MPGSAAVAMWWDIPAAVRAEWEDWHTREHMPERLGIPGFLRGTRWVSFADAGAYFVLYETTALSTITSGAYLERLNHPTPWSRRMMPHHKNMVRSLCVVRSSYDDGVPYALATARFSGAETPELPRGRGVTNAYFLEAQAMPAAQTTEQEIRGGDAVAAKVLVVGGYDADAVADAAHEAAPRDAVIGVYRLAYCLEARR